MADPRTGWQYTFTVFTPTRDRAHSLPRVYASLGAQTFRDFEWLVVDDGSVDGSPELLQDWQRQAPFPIGIIRKENSEGKFEAMRTAVTAARGRFFLTLDSDDECVPGALERFAARWESIPDTAKPGFSAVTALCVDQDGNLVGNEFPHDPTDSNSLEVRYRHRVRGEKWGFQRTDVMREALDGLELRAGFVPEGVLWNAIARRYRTRYVNERLRVYHQGEADRLSEPDDLSRVAEGGILAYGDSLNRDIAWFRYAPGDFWYTAALYARLSLHGDRSLSQQWRSLRPLARALWLSALPAGVGLYLMDVVGLRTVVRRLRRRVVRT